MNAPVQFPLTVFYDASCPMCASEMQTLKALDDNESLALVDCSTPEFEYEADTGTGVTKDTMMTLIHGRDASGRWLVGVDCFAAVYRAVGLEAAARIWGSPILGGFLAAIYPWVARHRQMLSRLGGNAATRLLIPKPPRQPARA